MKVALIVLLIAVGTVTCQQNNSSTDLSAADIQNNPKIQYLANYGAQNVAQEAIDAGDLPAGRYNITRIYSVSQQQEPNGVNYDFDVDIAAPGGNSTRVTFTVFDEANDDDEDVNAYTYQTGPGLDNVYFGDQDASDVDYSDNQALLGPDVLISEEEANLEWLGEAWLTGEDDNGNLGGYSQVSVNDFNNNQQAQDLLVFGLQDVVNDIIDRGDLDDDYPFEITQIHSISEQVVSGMNYQYDVEISNRRGSTGRILFVVYSQPWTRTERVSSYNYTITRVSRGVPVTVGSTSDSPISANDAFDDSDDSDNNLPGGYSPVDVNQAANDPQIQSAQNAGAEYVAQQGIATGVLPAGQYNVTNVESISKQVVNGINYRFDVDLSNGQGRDLRAQYIVYVQPRNNTQTVTSYKFNT